MPLLYRLGIGDSPEADAVVDDILLSRRVLRVPREVVEKLSPKSLAILEIRSKQDLGVLNTNCANSVLLGEKGADGWGVKYATEFHMTNDSGLFVPREQAEEKGYRPDEYCRWVGRTGDVLLPVYEGRMIGQFDFAKKGWVSGKGRTAVWRDIPWDSKVIEPQFLMARTDFLGARDREGNSKAVRGLKLGFMDVGSATNTRTVISGLTFDCPHGNKVPLLVVNGNQGTSSTELLCGILNAFAFDFSMRARLGGLTLNYFIVEETPLPRISESTAVCLRRMAMALAAANERFAPAWWSVRLELQSRTAWRAHWAISPNERLRLRCMLDASIASLYGLTRVDFHWILQGCDHAKDQLASKAFCRTLDSKGFWRVDKDHDPELRHTVLSLVAFDALDALIAEHNGDRDGGIAAFSALNDGEGWMLPETLRLADHGLGHDEQAKEARPVASRLGPRFLNWQLAQTPEESWAECERHARAILGDEEFERRFGANAGAGSPPPVATPEPPPQKGGKKGKKVSDRQGNLF